MLLSSIVEASRNVSETSKRLEKTAILAAVLKQLSAEEIEPAVAFLSGTLRQGKMGIGYATLHGAMPEPSVKAALEIQQLDRLFDQLAGVKGSGAEQRKRFLLGEIFRCATREEQQFLFRLIGGELRQGALEGIMLDALAKATSLPAERIRRAAMMAGGSTAIAHTVFEKGEAGLAQFDIQLFRPVQPMLAQSAEDVAAALEELGEAALEFKLDGARIQVHKQGDRVAVFSRAANEVTAAVPEVVEAVRALPARELILDGEVLSLTPQGRPQPFQVSMRRFGRKQDVGRLAAELPMTPFWFDLIYLDGSPLVDEAQGRRFDQLVQLAPAKHVIPHMTTNDPQRAQDFVTRALEEGHEGVMAKAIASPYAAGARGQSWLKIKQARTLDLVVLAAEWGNGRRKGFLSNLHLGARDTEKGGFAMLGKTFKGLTDEMLAWQTAELLKVEVARDHYTVYVKPRLIVEIAFNEIQVSPRYVSGLSLRFARVKRYRADKTAADADTFLTVQKLAIVNGSA
jgi:DNA ligase 1